MTTQELQAELASIKAMLAKLQSSVDHLSALVEASQGQATNPAIQTRWLTLAGVGAEVWQSVDVETYIDEEPVPLPMSVESYD